MGCLTSLVLAIVDAIVDMDRDIESLLRVWALTFTATHVGTQLQGIQGLMAPRGSAVFVELWGFRLRMAN